MNRRIGAVRRYPPRSFLRWAFPVAMLSLVAPILASADSGSIPVVTRIAGTLTVRPASGAPHDVGLLQSLRSGDVVMTGPVSWSDLVLEGVVTVRLGSGTSVQVFTPSGGLALRLDAGTLCVEADQPSVTISTKDVGLSPQHAPASFDATVDSTGTKVYVDGGAITAATKAGSATMYNGEALIVGADGKGHHIVGSALGNTFAQCPQTTTQNVAPASPTAQPEASVQPASGGGGGGALGWILGLLAVGAAAAGHGGGSSSSATSMPTPTQSPSPSPLPSPSPGPVQPNPNVFDFSASGQTGQLTVNENNFNGSFTVADSANNPCTGPGIASVSPTTGTSATTFTVTSGNSGNCAFVVSNGVGQTAEVRVFVTSGSLTVNPQSIRFDDISSAPTPAAFVANDANNVAGFYSSSTSNAAVATVTCDVPCLGMSASFTVTPVGDGQATINVTDSVPGSQASVSIGVGTSPLVHQRHPLASGNAKAAPTPAPKPLPGRAPAVVPQPAGSLNVGDTFVFLSETGDSRTVAVTDAGYIGPIVTRSSNPEIASANAQSAGTSAWTLVITARGFGTATITITDARGLTRTVVVRVFSPPKTKNGIH